MAYNDPGKPRTVDIVEKAAAPPKGTLKVEGYSATQAESCTSKA